MPRPGWRVDWGDEGLCKGCCAHCHQEAGASDRGGVRGVRVESAQLGVIPPPAWGHVAMEGHVGWHDSGRCYWHLVGRAQGCC